ncbi:MAG: hypothetical protein ACTHJ1_13530 [Bordetella sp.]|uniref:hypothetical protein n=1 Tax=Bordetella sp. TaxID=28081 RepID=UPI003F7C040C
MMQLPFVLRARKPKAMTEFGVRFTFKNSKDLAALSLLYSELKRDKDSDHCRDHSCWPPLIPPGLIENFGWLDANALSAAEHRRRTRPVVIDKPADQLSARWNFDSLVDSINTGDYSLLRLEVIGRSLAELRIYPYGYPYGGLGPLIALAEGFGFFVVGLNEYGKYQTRQELLSQ